MGGRRRPQREGAQAAADGAYEIQGVPDGTWTVEATSSTPDAEWFATGRAEAGGTLDLVLRPR